MLVASVASWAYKISIIYEQDFEINPINSTIAISWFNPIYDAKSRIEDEQKI